MIHKATLADACAVATLACLLWPHHNPEEMNAEFSKVIVSPDSAVFLYLEKNSPIAFAQCSLRRDYVEGTDSSPVGYLEGIFVRSEHRHKGIARQLLSACEAWAKSMGCTEFASDCELANADSLRFHLHTGFAEVNRIICFTKTI